MTLTTDPEVARNSGLRANGQQNVYVVLSDEERAKGFVRPVRESYKHVGVRPKNATRDLTVEEMDQYKQYGYVAYEAYPDGDIVTGRFWTKAQLESGCGTVTSMGRALAETYARDPGFYGGTFCCGCRAHYPVGTDGEFEWLDGSKVGS